MASSSGPRRKTCRVRLTRSVLTRASWRGMPSITVSPTTPAMDARTRTPRVSAWVGKVQSLKGLRRTNSA